MARHSARSDEPDGPDELDGTAGEAGLYLVVVMDALTHDVDTYGPLSGSEAGRVASELQQLLIGHGPAGVLVTLARFHDRHTDTHPDDPDLPEIAMSPYPPGRAVVAPTDTRRGHRG